MSRAVGRGRQRPWARAATGPAGTWAIKHVVSPLDRWLHQVSAGRVRLSGSRPVLLLTTIGRRTGQRRVTPVFYLRDRDRLVVCNVRPAGERPNPWPRNLEATPDTVVEIGARTLAVTARRATHSEIDRLWPRLLEIWPAYGRHFAATGERHVIVLEPRDGHLPEPPPTVPRRPRRVLRVVLSAVAVLAVAGLLRLGLAAIRWRDETARTDQSSAPLAAVRARIAAMRHR